MSDHAYGTLEILQKDIANMGNEIKCHCRIGKVTRKIRRHYAPGLNDLVTEAQKQMFPRQPFINADWKQSYMEK